MKIFADTLSLGNHPYRPRLGAGKDSLPGADGVSRLLELPMPRSPRFAEALPFSIGDVTAGCENELQAVVVGRREAVDLPITITQSRYYKSMLKRAAAGDTSGRLVADLKDYMSEDAQAVWENSWVRFPKRALGGFATGVFEHDLLADKGCPQSPRRGDAGHFVSRENGEACIRVPVSYFLKLALAEAIGGEYVNALVRYVGKQCMEHFLSDNSSPEVYSFHPVPVNQDFGLGRGLANETLKRFLLCQVLAMYGNRVFELCNRGQQTLVYCSPHPPVRQKRLNDLLSDALYRELFMSPCLSGWNQGEAKHRYMHLCHEMLSRSQLNAVAKLKDANIITRNLVVLPNISNISLANNGTHISLGSQKLTALLKDPQSGFGIQEEKYLGDLVAKIVEHFLPLFVGTYSAAPYRLDFWDFHPEKALGFLPHELDFTHLRMIWRRWKKKAHVKFFGRPLTPFGPEWLDRFISRALGLKGDFLVDFRLIDYPVSLLSTEWSPALDGTLGNDEKLKKDLYDMGVFHPSMSLYLLYKLRQFAAAGYSGFEGRHYSVFENFGSDMAEAINLQVFLTALAYKYVLQGSITHADIPDTPSVESERRQVFFGTAIGIPTFYVRKDTGNRFMCRILNNTAKTRMSRRYSGYVRVHNDAYRKRLLEMMRNDGRDLIDLFGMQSTFQDLARRIDSPKEYAAAGKLTKGILEQVGTSSPMKVSANEFNASAEKYYRETLRKRHIIEACNVLLQECRALEAESDSGQYRKGLFEVLGERDAGEFLAKAFEDMDRLAREPQTLRRIIHLILLIVYRDMERVDLEVGGEIGNGFQNAPSIH